jgi:hypothetical protein
MFICTLFGKNMKNITNFMLKKNRSDLLEYLRILSYFFNYTSLIMNAI